MKMNKWVWYSLVVLAVWLLVHSFVEKDFLKGIIALVIALFLKKQYHNIPLPNAIIKHQIYSRAKQRNNNQDFGGT